MIQTQATVVDIQHSPNKQVAFVYFKPEETFTFQEWQFIFLERLWFAYPDGKAMKNAYSIGTTNTLLQEQWVIGTIVKKSSQWGMSEYLTQHIAIWDTIKLTGPLGHFVDKKISRNYVFVSIGSGITPVYSLYNRLLQSQDFDRIINIFGERHKENLLPTVVDAYTSNDLRVTNMLYLSQEKELPVWWQAGYVQQALEYVFEVFTDQEFQIFLCGKPVMVDDVVAILLDRGIEKEYIHFEKY
jgi:ferredoxin-NADP reductase